MNNLVQAQALLKEPITIETMLELDRLCQRSYGDEASQIGDLWEAAMVQAGQDVIDAYYTQTVEGK